MKLLNYRLLLTILTAGFLFIIGGCGAAKLTLQQTEVVKNKQVMYTQTGIWYIPKKSYFVATGTNYASGDYLPPNTKVTVSRIEKKYFIFNADGKTIYMYNVPKYTGLNMSEFFDRTLKPTPVDMGKFTSLERKSMKTGLLKNGMSKEAVLVSRGYPPIHKTPSISGDTWVYWNSRGYHYPLIFKNGRVSMPSGEEDSMNYAIAGGSSTYIKPKTTKTASKSKTGSKPVAKTKTQAKPKTAAVSKPKPKPVAVSKPKPKPKPVPAAVVSIPAVSEGGGTELDAFLLNKKAKTTKDPKKYALIFGIRTYDRQADVPYADNSAQSFNLMAEKILGIPTENIFMLVNDKATSGRIKANVALVTELAERGDSIYFFFAGHGVPGIDGNTYILPSDMTADAIHLEPKLKLDTIYAQLATSKASRIYIFIDSCFSGRDDTGAMIYRGAAPVFKKKKHHFSSRKLTVMTAGSVEDFANQYDKQKQRLFSYYLIKGFADEKKNKDIKTLYEYVRRNVKRESLRIGLGYKQIPQLQMHR